MCNRTCCRPCFVTARSLFPSFIHALSGSSSPTFLGELPAWAQFLLLLAILLATRLIALRFFLLFIDLVQRLIIILLSVRSLHMIVFFIRRYLASRQRDRARSHRRVTFCGRLQELIVNLHLCLLENLLVLDDEVSGLVQWLSLLELVVREVRAVD